MSWRESLRPASFRGVPFFVSEAEGKGGRRLVVHEYPLRDDPFVEDLGRDTRGFSLSAYVLGANYFFARDALLAALEKRGAGTLVHPYLGTKQVACREFSFRETASEGGMASFAIEFVEAGLQLYPSVLADVLSRLSSAASNLVAAGRAAFLSAVSVTGVPDFVRAAFGNSVSDLGTLLESLQGGARAPGSQDAINEAARLRNLLADVKGSALSFITQPAGVASALESLFAGLGTSRDPALVVRDYQLVRARPAPILRAETTPLVALENRNRTATRRYGDLLSLAGEATALSDSTFVSREDALAARERFLAAADALMPGASDAEFTALQDLRTAVSAALPGEEGELPHLRTVTLPAAQPAIVLAYTYYKNVSREAEIVSRNKVTHPGFLPAGVPLEVLGA